MIRIAWILLNLTVATIPLGIVVIAASMLGVHGDIHYRISRLWSRWALWASGCRVRAYGLENIAPDRAQIIAANHASWLDVVALAGTLPKRNRFIAKQELTRVPLWGWAWQAAGHIAIDRGDTQRAVESLDRAATLVKQDHSCIVIFPEGTRSDSDQMLPFKKGAFMLALRSGIEIVPAGVQGTRAILPKHGWRLRPGPIIVRFGPPVPTTEYGEAGRDQLMARVRSEIDQLRTALPPATDDGTDVDHQQRTRP